MNFDKYKIFLTVFFCFSAVAAGEITVKSLSQGSCYIDDSTRGVVKASSFADNSAVIIDDFKLNSLKDLNLPIQFSGAMNAFVHCGSYGLSFIFNIEEKSQRYCLWTDIKNGEFSVRSFGLIDGDNKGNCNGYKMNTIVLSMKKNQLLQEEFLQRLEDGEFSEDVESFEKVSQTVLSLKLHPHLAGSENLFIAKLKDFKAIRIAEKSFYYHPIGEYMEVLR